MYLFYGKYMFYEDKELENFKGINFLSGMLSIFHNWNNFRARRYNRHSKKRYIKYL